MRPRAPDPLLVAAVLRELRRRSSPVTWRALARTLRTIPRRCQEAVWQLRCRGQRIVSGPRGVELTRSRQKVEAFVAREERRMRRERRALAGVKRGHVPQAQIPAVRRRRAA